MCTVENINALRGLMCFAETTHKIHNHCNHNMATTSTSSGVHWNAETISSLILLVLYVLLIALCIYCHLRIKARHHKKMKASFFLLMGFCLAIDIPRLGWCISANSGDHTAPFCQNKTIEWEIIHALHLVAVMGYFICLGIPICMWASMITGTEVDIFDFNYSSLSKRVLHGAIVSNIVFSTFDICADFESKRVEDIGMGFNVLTQLLILCIWLYVGISLQRLVYTCSRGNSFNFMHTLNFVIIVVLLAYLSRAALLADCVMGDCSHVNYYVFIFGTQCLPFCIGNYLIIRLMAISLRYGDSINNSSVNTQTGANPFTSRSLTHNTGGFDALLYFSLTPDDSDAYGDDSYNVFTETATEGSVDSPLIVSRKSGSRVSSVSSSHHPNIVHSVAVV
jgi:hypothetical protein